MSNLYVKVRNKISGDEGEVIIKGGGTKKNKRKEIDPALYPQGKGLKEKGGRSKKEKIELMELEGGQ